MTSQEQLELIEKLDNKTLSLIKSKSNDYASEDVLSNFKIVSNVIKTIGINPATPEGYATLMVILKFVRIWNLKTESKDIKNESLLDSYEDAINYLKLAYCCEVENNNSKFIRAN
jgi:hypothetical protein